MLSLVLVAAMLQPSQGPPSADGPPSYEQRVIEIPREIARNLDPYLHCILRAFADEGDVTPIVSVATARAAQQRALATCQPVRNRVRTAAIASLSRSDIERSDREAFVDRALETIERSQDAIVRRFETIDQQQ